MQKLVGRNQKMNYKNIQQFLKEYDQDNVIFCYGNYAVANIVENLMISARAVGLPIVLFALDTKILSALKGKCDIVEYFDNSMDPSKYYEYGTEEFKEVVWWCWLIGNEILQHNKSFIYMDVDITVKQNFEQDILQQYKGTDYDGLFQFNGTNCCAGFFSLRPTPKTVDLFTMEFLEQHQYLHYAHDQDFFNTIVWKRLLKTKFLNRDEYPTGKYYYEHHKRIDDMCKIIHWTDVIGYRSKVKTIERYGYWNL